MPFVIRHLLESTLFCILLSSLACCLKRGAAVRHAVWLIGISKFAIPSVLLTAAGARIAFFWPAASWLAWAANKVSAALLAVSSMLPGSIDSRNLLAIWSLGATTLFGIWLVRLRNGKRPSKSPTNEEQQVMDRAQDLLRVRKPIQLRASEATDEPALWGIWRPVVGIPKGLSQRLTGSEFEAVLLHELAHARRYDNLTGVFAHCLVCVFWFHPLLWLAEKRLHMEKERACDELVLACGIEPQTYASGILKICKFHLFEAAAGVSAMTGSDLKRRLELILEYKLSARLLYVPRLLIAALAILMTMAPIAGGYCEQCVSNGQGHPQQNVFQGGVK